MKKISSQLKIKGFTLIELLVVVGIIGILAAVVYASFGDARKASRDDIRKSDLKELQLAIELYKAQYGYYPDGCNDSSTNWSGSNPGSTYNCPGTMPVGCNGYICGLVPDFINELPLDPNQSISGSRGYIYRTRGGVGTANEFKLMAHNSVEFKFITSYTDEFARCPVSGSTACPASPVENNNYAVYNGGTTIQGW